jgi:hypothetical protein
MERKTEPESSDLPKPRRHGDPPQQQITRAAWERHKDYQMSFALGHGYRPDGWWLYERNTQPPKPPYTQMRILYEMGELQGGELKTVVGWFRGYYDDAHESFPDNPTKYWRWKDIPPALIEQWDGER